MPGRGKKNVETCAWICAVGWVALMLYLGRMLALNDAPYEHEEYKHS